MNSFTLIVLCFQACLLQSVIGQCKGFGQKLAGATANPGFVDYKGPGFAGPGLGGLRYPNEMNLGLAGARQLAATPPAMYGGTGEGGVSVAGELPMAGTTVINGQVPVTGAVKFNGNVPAGGVVTITGTCACGCKGLLMH